MIFYVAISVEEAKYQAKKVTIETIEAQNQLNN